MSESAVSSVIGDILDEADRQGLSQKALAAASGIQEESLSRLKKRGNARLDVIGRLADAAGLRLAVVPRTAPVASARQVDHPAPPDDIRSPVKTFRQKYPALVWSNRQADDVVFIRRALLDPQFPVLLDAALEFGMDRLEEEWRQLLGEDSVEARRAASVNSRLLTNLRRGYDKTSR